jgi:hypothetical protein
VLSEHTNADSTAYDVPQNAEAKKVHFAYGHVRQLEACREDARKNGEMQRPPMKEASVPTNPRRYLAHSIFLNRLSNRLDRLVGVPFNNFSPERDRFIERCERNAVDGYIAIRLSAIPAN